MQPPLVRLFLVFLLVAISPGSALPPPGPPPTAAEIWDRTDATVYGEAVRIQIDASGEYGREVYDSTLRIERSWKGNLMGDIRIEGDRDCGCYFDQPFNIHKTYLVLLKRLPDRDAYAPAQIFPLKLPLGSTPSASNNPDAIFGNLGPQEPICFDEFMLELLEFSESKAGNDTEAKRIHDLRMGPILARERIDKKAAEKAKEEAEFNTAALRDFETARTTENLTQRKSLLLALKLRFKDRFDDGAQELKGKIIGELSVADTLLTNGVKTSPKSRP